MGAFWHDAQIPLVLFTLFTQAAVGMFCVLLVNDFLKRNEPDRDYDAFTRIGTYILVPLTGLGLVFSTLHLGRPTYAWRALFNLESSPLSREVWAFSLFFGLAAVYTYLWHRRSLDTEVRRLVGTFTGVVGLAALYVQAQVYRIPGRPQWDHLSTEALFYASAFLLGPLLVAFIYNLAWGRFVNLRSGEPVVRQSHRRLGLTLLGVVLVQGMSLVWRMQHLASDVSDGPAVLGRALTGKETVLTALALGREVLNGTYGWMLPAQVLLSLYVPATLAIALWWWHRRGGSLRAAGWMISLTLALALAGEFVGRALFYLTGVPWF